MKGVDRSVIVARSRFEFIFLSLAIMTLCGCVSAPDAVSVVRDAELTAQWVTESAEDATRNAQPVDSSWWLSFDDPALTKLIESAAKSGYDIRKSQARLREAQAMSRQVRSALWPSVNSTGSYTFTEQSVNAPNGPGSLIQAGFIDRDLEFWGAELAAQWDVDLFGANRFASRSASARVEANLAALAAVRLATVSQVALAYVQYTSIEQRLTLLNDNVSAQAAALDILTKRFDIGLESRLNVDRAAGELAANRASVPTLLAQRKKTVYQLALLTTIDLESLQELLVDAKAMMAAELPSVGVKSHLLARRPDIKVAEFQLYSAGFEVGRARADLMPKLVIGATSGFVSGSTSTLFDSASRALALAPSINYPLFNRGRVKAARDAALARYDFALAHYQHTVISAFTDAESMLLGLNAARDSAALYAEAAQRNRAAQERAAKLYDRGLLSYLGLLDAQRQSLRAEDAAVLAAANRDAALVQLYVSLGGGWHVESGIADAPR